MENNQPTEEFTDEDFNYSAAQFDVDYLERISSEGEPQPSALTRESLYVKFDPLVSKGSPRKGAKVRTRQEELASNDLMMLNTPPSKGESRLPAAVNVDTDTSTTPLSAGHEWDTTQEDPVHYSSDDILMTPEEEGPGVSILDTTDASNMHIVTEQQEELKYTEDEAVYMVKAAELEGRNSVREEYAGQLAALQEELAALQSKSEAMESVEEAWQPSEDNYRADIAILDQRLQLYKNLDLEYQQLETKMSDTSERERQRVEKNKAKEDSVDENFLSLETSFNDLLQRYIKLKQETENLYKSREGLKQTTARLEKVNGQLTSKMETLTEECWKQLDESNRECETLRKELSSKLAVERANSKRLELQVMSMERNLVKKEQDKQHLTNLCEQVMSELQ